MYPYETYLSLDLDAIEQNLSAIAKKAKTKILAVVKADAYGHGAVPLAKHLESRSDFFGVACAAEALELRAAGITKPILIFGHTPVEAFPEIIRQQIRPAIFRMDDAIAFSKEVAAQGVHAPIHIALDTGEQISVKDAMYALAIESANDVSNVFAEHIAVLPSIYL